MKFYADLHIHSKYSRATASNCDLENLSLWAQKKGISVVATGDFTHPVWFKELKQKLIPDGNGLFSLLPETEKEIERALPPSCRRKIRFMLSVEISTIYKKGEKTRKVHHVIYAPDFDSAENIIKKLSKIGNLKSDGRPILGLDSRHLLEIVLESGEGAYLIPAHIWTPWFSALGSKSGFDSIDECYGDLAKHIFAAETGLSSDPAMNWRVSSLDRLRLVSNSDAHSPPNLGREATIFDIEPDYFSIRNALETGKGYIGTVEFFPEEGKYHLDGHRKCNLRLSPQETKDLGGRCPSCGGLITVGVLSRVEELADRGEKSPPPKTAGKVKSLIPFCEILSEIVGVNPKSQAVMKTYEELISRLGSELGILAETPIEEIKKSSSVLIAEAISRLRKGEVIREAGYDGEYGVIRLFNEQEIKNLTHSKQLFETPKAAGQPGDKEKTETTNEKKPKKKKEAHFPLEAEAKSLKESKGKGVLSGLDDEQRAAAEAVGGAVLIVAGPGSGKTRTLTHRIAHLVADYGALPEACLAITFTRKAADEMRERLKALAPGFFEQIPIFTFHSFGFQVLREHIAELGYNPQFRVASEQEQAEILKVSFKITEQKAYRLLNDISLSRRSKAAPLDETLANESELFRSEMRNQNILNFDDLISLTVELLEKKPEILALLRKKHCWVSIDEYQDIDAVQYRLVKLIAPANGNICAIGDPNQGIYGFRGADIKFFSKFAEDFPGAKIFRLARNYRSTNTIVEASSQVIASSGSQKPAIAAEIKDASRIAIREAPSEAAEAEFIVHTIEQMLGGHSFFSIDSGRAENAGLENLSFSDVAVLYRTEAQAGSVCEAFERSGMPFQKRSHTRLGDLPAVQAIAKNLESLPSQEPLKDRIKRAAETLKKENKGLDAAGLLEAVELLTPVAEKCEGDTNRFVSELSLGIGVDSFDERADRVSLLTLHASKGLEFKVVFIIGCEEGLLPLTFGGKAAAEIEEERRLFYV
ncbi:MAG: UvrD-helicase domain-containing protein, partial [Phycisphaerae bacterium]|nr:UvrD-helicase domain-containing protein [Phycisphaerae bacterium]